MNSSEVGSLHLESDAAHSAKQIMNTKERVMIFSGTYFESSKRTKNCAAELQVFPAHPNHVEQRKLALDINFFGLLSVEVLSERIIGVYAFCVSEMTFCCSPFQCRSSSSFRSCDLQENHSVKILLNHLKKQSFTGI
ncbi:hypothetical protein T4A_1781 [Trichinella pseudospiralis]|uniref:Uncharacterized protein n=1 Tax=Trichinella pseudospiralis TaxID=6337 RepID=A0A0V1JLN8_TRIPS|nr:hypothetical protein T4A_1781 [Trichinella pseudospiralis]KRZ35896.1 hypothetical protein T4C_12765 [Trichinella pseudospiralis]